MNAVVAAPGASAFVRSVLSILDKVEYRHCDKGEDFEDICRLRYRSYHSSGIIPSNSSLKISDELDEKPNCFNFGVYVEERLISTVRVHHVDKDNPFGSSATAYPELIIPRLDAGEHFVDPSRLATDPDWAREYPQMPYVTTRIVVMACIYFGVHYCLLTVRPNHAGFYKRVFGAEQIGEPRSYPNVNCDIDLRQVDIPVLCAEYIPRFLFFKSSELERKLLFGRPAAGEIAPLTVLPTAGSLRVAA